MRWLPLVGPDLPLADRIQRAAFAVAMLIVLVIGTISITLSMHDIPARDEEGHATAVRVIGERLAGNIGNRLAYQENLSRSSLVWTALTDTADRDAYLAPFLAGSESQAGRHDLFLLDYRGRPMAGQPEPDFSAALQGRALTTVLQERQPAFIVQASPPVLLAAYPVLFPYSQDIAGILVGRYDLGAMFRADIAGLNEGHGIALFHGRAAIAQMPPQAALRYMPARFSLALPGGKGPAGLYLEVFGTNRDDWVKPILRRLALYLALGLAFAALVWHLARRVALSLTHRLQRLASACAEVAAGRPFTLDEDPAADEIGLLSRTLRQAIRAHEQVEASLERLVDQKAWALNESLERYRQSFEVNTAIKLIVDSDTGRIFDANTAAVRYYGYSRERLLSLNISAINCLPPDEVKAKMAAAASADQKCFLFRHRLASGEIRDVEVHSGPVTIAGRLYLHSIIQDVTERRRLEAELAVHRQHLERQVAERTADLTAANKELQGFTYAASHDLKAPLGRINSFSALLERKYRERLDGDGLLFLDLIRSNAVRMTALIEDLLEHAQVEQHTLHLQPLDLRSAVQAALQEQSEEIRESGAEIRLELPPLAVCANPQGLAQILRNILGNALKYAAQAKPPVIEIGGRQQERTCCLWVRDNGIGFDMRYHERIFEIFRRLHTYEEFPGSGVGLALVKKAMERMGGEVWAEGQPGRGATFFLELPTASLAELPTATESPPAVA